MKRITLILALVAVAVALRAQDNAMNTPVLQGVVMLDTVEVVSTPKEHGTLRQQPSAVSSLLPEPALASVKGVSALVPNFFIPDYGSRITSAVYIRGVGSRINTPAVALYVDNMPVIDKSAYDFTSMDIERVDIVRGPQGTLYGRNAMGGVIKIYTKNPLTHKGTDVDLLASTGNNRGRVALTHYQPFSDSFAMSLGAFYEHTNGFFTNSTTGERVDNGQSAGAKARAVWRPTNRFALDAFAQYEFVDEGAYPYFYDETISANRESSYRRSLLNAGLNIEQALPRVAINYTTGLQHLSDRMFLDQDFIAEDIYTLCQKQRITTLTQEVTMKSRERGAWQHVTGAYAMYQNLHTSCPVTFYSDGLAWLSETVNSVLPKSSDIAMLQTLGFNDMQVTFTGDEMCMGGTFSTPTLGAALYHQSTLRLTQQLKATLGLRLDYEHQALNYNAPAVATYDFLMENSLRPAMTVSAEDLCSIIDYEGKMSRNYFRLLPKVALQYEFDSRNNIYASVALGQRSGGYNMQMFSDLLEGALKVDMMQQVKACFSEYVQSLMEDYMPQYETPTTEQIVYKPEYSWNYELGAHLSPAPALTLDLAAFYNIVYDQQIARFADSGLGRVMVNAGKSRSYGAELSMGWHATRALLLSANYGYTNSRFVDYNAGDEDYSGNYVPFAPMHTLNIDGAYTFATRYRLLRAITLGASLTGAGKIYWTEDNSAVQPFYLLPNARIVFELPNATFTLAATNLSNTSYNTFYFISASRAYEQHGRPTQLVANLTIRL